eukprot:CAMPEP_0194054730 /NCGR_PEP_ID=MMETSP0009_2-20130614/54366_1 /TAXON_ID=210454 /ORGANISM="Grammatophora oceanica, Strain CCMP 410" /LENGTH=33 /DNA_ID= /DNA_START= /DNA_END= /DNA_ORIENTATION=
MMVPLSSEARSNVMRDPSMGSSPTSSSSSSSSS